MYGLCKVWWQQISLNSYRATPLDMLLSHRFLFCFRFLYYSFLLFTSRISQRNHFIESDKTYWKILNCSVSRIPRLKTILSSLHCHATVTFEVIRHEDTNTKSKSKFSYRMTSFCPEEVVSLNQRNRNNRTSLLNQWIRNKIFFVANKGVRNETISSFNVVSLV